MITVIAPLPGAGAADVADQVTKPIEQAISGVPRLAALQSTSANSLALVIAQFAVGTNVKETQALIQQNVDAANLPPTVDPTVAALNINSSPVIIASVAATTPDGLSEAARIVQTEIQPALLAIEGVASVDVSGGDEQQIAVTLDPAKLAKANVSEAQIVGVLTANNVTVPSGQVQGDGTKTPVSTIGVIGSVDEISNMVVGVAAPAAARAPARPRTPARASAQPAASGRRAARRPRRSRRPRPKPITIGDLGTVGRRRRRRRPASPEPRRPRTAATRRSRCR